VPVPGRDGSRRSRTDLAKAENGCPGLAVCLASCIESEGVIAQGGQGHASFLQVCVPKYAISAVFIIDSNRSLNDFGRVHDRFESVFECP
jgi:hypothetical protein